MSPEDELRLLTVLRDKERHCIERLKAAGSLELVFWDDPNKNPPNLSRAEFERALPTIPQVQVKWSQRDSDKGKYGKTGEDQVFMFEFEVTSGRLVSTFYVKGFFFNKDDLKGVEIQSFRRERVAPRGRGKKKLKLVKS